MSKTSLLTWGVKESFRNYVQATGGTATTGAGAEQGADGAFSFSAAPGEGLVLGADGRPTGTGAFLGEVTFEAHGGMLKVFLADPIIEIGPAGATITVADTPSRNGRVEIAKLDLSAMGPGEGGELVIPTLLSMEGVYLLGAHYPLNTPLDPVRLRLPV